MLTVFKFDKEFTKNNASLFVIANYQFPPYYTV